MLGTLLALIDDESLIGRFEKLYNSEKNIIYNMVYDILKDEYLSEDVVMDSFFVLAEHFKKLSDKTTDQVRNYLFVIARNRAVKIYFKNKKMKNAERDYETFDELPDIQNVEFEIENKELQSKVFDFIKRMDFKYSDVLLLKCFYGFKNSEIARSLNIDVNNVNQRLFRARKQIEKMIAESHGKMSIGKK